MSTKKRTIAQQAGTARRKLKRQGIEFLTDYKGTDVPIDYVPNIDLLEHYNTMELLEEARSIREQLEAFKAKVQTTGDEIYTQMLAEAGVDSPNKNFTLSTFNKGMKIIFKRPPKYTQDEKELAISREFKKKWLEDEAENVPEYIIDLVVSLLESKDGNIDQAQISELNKMTQKIRNKNFRKMVEHFNKSLDAYYAKRYEQFLYKDNQGKEQSIVMNYADAEPRQPEQQESKEAA